MVASGSLIYSSVNHVIWSDCPSWQLLFLSWERKSVFLRFSTKSAKCMNRVHIDFLCQKTQE